MGAARWVSLHANASCSMTGATRLVRQALTRHAFLAWTKWATVGQSAVDHDAALELIRFEAPAQLTLLAPIDCFHATVSSQVAHATCRDGCLHTNSNGAGCRPSSFPTNALGEEGEGGWGA